MTNNENIEYTASRVNPTIPLAEALAEQAQVDAVVSRLVEALGPVFAEVDASIISLALLQFGFGVAFTVTPDLDAVTALVEHLRRVTDHGVFWAAWGRRLALANGVPEAPRSV